MMHPELKRIAELPASLAVEQLLKAALDDASRWDELVVERSDSTKPASHFIAIYQRRQANPFVGIDQIRGFAESLDSLKKLPEDTPVTLTLFNGSSESVTVLEASNLVVACMIHKSL